MMIGSRLVAACVVSIIATGDIPSAAAEFKGLTPHRAVYDITLVDARPGAGITELSGRMVYELTGSSCAGYTQKMRFVTRTTAPRARRISRANRSGSTTPSFAMAGRSSRRWARPSAKRSRQTFGSS